MDIRLYQTPKGIVPFNEKDHGIPKNYLTEDYTLLLHKGNEIAGVHKSKIVLLQNMYKDTFYFAEVAPREQKDEPDIVIPCRPGHIYHGIEQRAIDSNQRIICLNLIGVVVPGLIKDGDGDEYEGKIMPISVPDLKYVPGIMDKLVFYRPSKH